MSRRAVEALVVDLAQLEAVEDIGLTYAGLLASGSRSCCCSFLVLVELGWISRPLVIFS